MCQIHFIYTFPRSLIIKIINLFLDNLPKNKKAFVCLRYNEPR